MEFESDGAVEIAIDVGDVVVPERPRGTSWTAALLAVTAALLPSLLGFGIWLGTGDDIDPTPERVETSFRLADLELQLDRLGPGAPVDVGEFSSVLAVQVDGQLDHDECRSDFEQTVGEPTRLRTPFYFC